VTMPHALKDPPAGFDDLPIDQQINYVQSLWDRIAAKEALVQVPAATPIPEDSPPKDRLTLAKDRLTRPVPREGLPKDRLTLP